MTALRGTDGTVRSLSISEIPWKVAGGRSILLGFFFLSAASCFKLHQGGLSLPCYQHLMLTHAALTLVAGSVGNSTELKAALHTLLTAKDVFIRCTVAGDKRVSFVSTRGKRASLRKALGSWLGLHRHGSVLEASATATSGEKAQP